jgi:protein-tyrosine phosphatase
MAAWAIVLLLPYLAVSWLTWYASRWFTRSRTYDEVVPGVFLGRRPYRRELPPGVATVIDLTAEFPVARGVAVGRRYVCVPTLDRMATPDAPLARLVASATDWNGPVYVHCASGHGRSAALVIALLVARGSAPDVMTAEAMVRRARPHIRLAPSQRRAIEAVIDQHRRANP